MLLAAALASCSAPAAQPLPEPGARLTATLVSPVDITLDWTGDDPGAAGRILEFATDPRGTYTILQFMPLRQLTYKHPDLLPETPFYYRLRPFSGPASAPVEITLPPGDYSEKDQQNDHEWAPPQKIADGGAVKRPIRLPDAAAAAPTDLTATVMHANGIRFTWTDHASDEDGYLLESKPEGSADYTQVMVLDPDIDSVGLITLPTEKKASYRVRAFYYGKQSNVAHQTTGQTPAGR
jgi:hypothetical protein